MELWLDSINYDLIKKAHRMGILHGVTTNPSILAQSKEKPEKILNTLIEIQTGPVTAQVMGQTVEEMVAEGAALSEISDRLIVKVPVTEEGLEALYQLSQKSIPTMATVIFHSRQVYLAALAGADYAAPYFSRMHAVDEDATAQLEAMHAIIERYALPTKLLVASLKTADQVSLCLKLGADAVTIKDSLFRELIATNEHTAAAVEQFQLSPRG